MKVMQEKTCNVDDISFQSLCVLGVAVCQSRRFQCSQKMGRMMKTTLEWKKIVDMAEEATGIASSINFAYHS